MCLPDLLVVNRGKTTKKIASKVLLSTALILAVPAVMPNVAEAGVYTRTTYRRVRVPRRVCNTYRTRVRYRTVYRYGRRYRQRTVTRNRRCRTSTAFVTRRNTYRRYY